MLDQVSVQSELARLARLEGVGGQDPIRSLLTRPPLLSLMREDARMYHRASQCPRCVVVVTARYPSKERVEPCGCGCMAGCDPWAVVAKATGRHMENGDCHSLAPWERRSSH